MVESLNRQWAEDQCSKNRQIAKKGKLGANKIEWKRTAEHFKVLGSVVDKDGTIDGDVDFGVWAAWSCCRKLSEVLYDKNIPPGSNQSVQGH